MGTCSFVPPESECEMTFADVDPAAVLALGEFLDQCDKGGCCGKIFPPSAGSVYRIHSIGAGEETEQELFVGDSRASEFAPDFLERRLRRFPMSEFPRPGPVQRSLSFTLGSMTSQASLPQSPNAYWIT